MKKKLHKGVKWVWRISSYLLALFFGIWLGVFSSTIIFGIWRGAFNSTIFGNFFIGFLVVVIILIILIEIWINLAYNRWFYEFTSNNLKIERGVIFKRYSNIPYERVQNIDIRRGIIARICRFSAVNIQTAGYSYVGRGRGFSAEGHIPAVDVNEAEKIRNFLIKKISKKSNQGL